MRVLIVDDETHARERLRRLLRTDDSVTIVGECASGAEALTAVNEFAPDLLLLDIQMPELDGMALVRAIGPSQMPLVIFVTAFDEHAVNAFGVNAVDYLLKPVEAPRLSGVEIFATSAAKGSTLNPLASCTCFAKA